jgi:2-dehydropantoate 2-reductase
MKFLVAGCGAIGSVIGGFLKKGGYDVSLLGREKHINAIRKNGLFISGIWGEYLIKNFKLYTEAKKIKEEFDYILITVKSYDTENMIKELKNLIKENTYIVSLQNGLGNFEKIKKIVKEDKIILGRVIFGAEIQKFGEVKVTVYGDKVMLGAIEKNKIIFEKIKELVKIFNRVGIPAEETKEIEKYIWGKVIYNCCLNGLGAILNVNYGALSKYRETKEIMRKIMEEIFKVAKKEKVKLFWDNANSYEKFFYKKLIPPTREHYPSMLQDLNSGKKTEIDYLNGAIFEIGKKNNIKTPVNEIITYLIKAKENREVKNFG